MALIKVEYRADTAQMVFSVGACGECVLDVGALSADVRESALLHGLKQKVSDAAALSRDAETGQSASPEEKFNAIRAQVVHLNSGGAWNSRVSTGGGETAGGLVLRALAAIQNRTIEEMSARIDQLAEKKQMTRRALLMKIRSQPDVQQKMSELRPPAKNAPDADGLLEELQAD